ncbi:hypothetical protein FQN53_001427 [Emmonsiellopsis sp. PD_33]|nr:hypothetical protein FQN53_001427 [Emmonsiellopsis sp. PD_33]
MPPPRQRTTANLDDSRSEASSSTRERHYTGTKGRRPANAPAGSSMSSKDMKVAAATASAGGPNAEADYSGEAAGKKKIRMPQTQERTGHSLPFRSHFPTLIMDRKNSYLLKLTLSYSKISWSSMPLSVLHEYRHAYKLPCPSAYSSQISSILLSQGVGQRSPTAIAARRAQLARRKADDGRPSKRDDNTNSTSANASASASGVSRRGKDADDRNRQEAGLDLHTVRGQGRVTKDHLATAVRKHFNNVGLAEQDAIARFLYKVREEGKDHEFRLRFQP